MKRLLTAHGWKVGIFFLVAVMGVGSWFLFGHASQASLAGTIVSRIEDCRHPNQKCLKELADKIVDENLLSEVLKVLEANASEPAVSSNCHLLTHFLGEKTHEKKANFSIALDQCSSFCSSGCYHGVAEGYFKEEIRKSGDLSNKAIAEGIEKLEPDGDVFHGLGHALMFLTDNDLPRSLNLCDIVENQREACYMGVFMSNSESLKDPDHPSRYIRENDIAFPCNILDKKYQETCFQNQTDYYLGLDVRENIKTCGFIPGEFQKDCYMKLATRHVYEESDPAELNKHCDPAPEPEIRNLCIDGLARHLQNIKGK